ncbi:TPA: hypothetical protein DD449_00765 [Candidatus Berkelbacteria bacterium]|uniref:Uncharacterized protein n=1 Tax=Berkelbacteria bacterium GW2011_GWE1_39_12 TaxID=1618337 RepID=A0A0G4B589_9BACT|nr:MAG: hypothetical protein UT28_C0001G0933 [Berkelbacteria bacterium GW2011_GWE1_39_12]HBO60203.1 hypothetical protein [Candidatus Berkelbacteria bacterium]
MELISQCALAHGQPIKGIRTPCYECNSTFEITGREHYFEWHGERYNRAEKIFPKGLADFIYLINYNFSTEYNLRRIYNFMVKCPTPGCRNWLSIQSKDSIELVVAWQYDQGMVNYAEYQKSWLNNLKEKLHFASKESVEHQVFRSNFEVRKEVHGLIESILQTERLISSYEGLVEQPYLDRYVAAKHNLDTLHSRLERFLVLRAKIERITEDLRNALITNAFTEKEAELRAQKDLESLAVKQKSDPVAWADLLSAYEDIIQIN